MSRFAIKTSIIFVGAVVVFLIGYLVGKVNFFENSFSRNSAKYTVSGDVKGEYQNVDVNLLWKVWDAVQSEYVTSDINGQNMLYGAVKGLVKGLDDPYTNYLTPKETEDYLKSNKGEFEGIGATLMQDGDYVSVETPLDDSPAKKAGILSGDVILKVNEEDMQGISVYEVASKIRGEAGTTVKLALFRPSKSEQIDVEIIRQKIDVDNIVYKGQTDGIAQIKIYKFTEDSIEAFSTQWDQTVEKVLADDESLKGIVIDLRNNPGGYVKSVEYVLGEFLPKGTVTYQEQDKNGKKVVYKVTRTGKLVKVPIVVLVNEGSASASEIFAAAIQDNNRGKVIGMSTVGKGVEQKPIVFDDGSMLQLVFQRWLTPNGKNISKEAPIVPDIEVEKYEDQDSKALTELQ